MIRLRDISRTFRVGDQDVRALDGISLDIRQGEYLSIMGPSGSGKSTLLNIIALLDHPDSGQYLLEGQDVTHLDDNQLAALRRQHIGFVFQFFHLIPRLSASENIAIPLMLAGVDPAERRQRIDAALATYGLRDRAAHRPEELSGGQRQRVAIARASIMRPQLLLADEPTGNLDRHSGHEIIEVLERLHGEGMTLLVVTHDPELGGRAGRQLHMLDGRLGTDSGQA